MYNVVCYTGVLPLLKPQFSVNLIQCYLPVAEGLNRNTGVCYIRKPNICAVAWFATWANQTYVLWLSHIVLKCPELPVSTLRCSGQSG